GRVIGAFGFLAQYKGFWKLLDIVRETPGAELVLYSHAKSEPLEASWREAAKNLPVRRIEDYLPAEEIARRLAAEADILVYWYSETSTISASRDSDRPGDRRSRAGFTDYLVSRFARRNPSTSGHDGRCTAVIG